ncbi:MAG: transposase [Candidatus Scalindua sp.]
MMTRRLPLLEGNIYHVYTKSIAGFVIFRNDSDYERLRGLLRYYKIEKPSLKFSAFAEKEDKRQFLLDDNSGKEELVGIIAYCCMPTHIHLILKQVKKGGISIFMNNVLNSYTRYFNIKMNRRGPLWESRFKSVMVTTDEQLLHLTRYIHLNPTTANLVDKPHDWDFSSYREFLDEVQEEEKVCNYSKSLNIDTEEYKEFVSSRIDIQQELARIKELCLD